jgi:serine/threonine protein kinase
VKVLAAATLRSASYRPAARREAAVLRALRHPATTRLASAFQWRGGVYLVLEHASGGDLHELLAAVGPLPEDTARFLLGEVAAALMHVHALGFAFGDCKPENVVLVAPPSDGGGDDAASWAAAGGLHAKLADFAACRPISTAGAAVLAEGRGVLRTLRSGDWRHGAGGGVEPAPAAAAAAGSSGSDSEGSDDGAEDNRIEGTPEYLAPELQGGASLPTVASDAYAFGVTLFQALVGGRLPDVGSLWPAQGGGGQGVRWAAPGAAEGGSCGGGFPPGFPAAAATLVRALLHPDAAQRLGGGPRGFEEVVEHPWFAALGCGVDKLFRERGPADPRHEGGGALQRADPQWARRHASMMWAPSLAAARALRLAGAEGAGVGGATGPPRAAAQLRLAELMALAALPPLAF